MHPKSEFIWCTTQKNFMLDFSIHISPCKVMHLIFFASFLVKKLCYFSWVIDSYRFFNYVTWNPNLCGNGRKYSRPKLGHPSVKHIFRSVFRFFPTFYSTNTNSNRGKTIFGISFMFKKCFSLNLLFLKPKTMAIFRSKL